MDVSVIIVNYNTIELTLNCINSIFTHTLGIDFEVIVVDNNSDDGSGEILRLDKRIVFIQNLANEGFGSANNIGYQYAKGKYLFLLNSDTILLNNAIKDDHSSNSLKTVSPDKELISRSSNCSAKFSINLLNSIFL